MREAWTPPPWLTCPLLSACTPRPMGMGSVEAAAEQVSERLRLSSGLIFLLPGSSTAISMHSQVVAVATK